MRYVVDATIKLRKHPNGKGGWLATLQCPVPGCAAEVSATGVNESGPYSGSCGNGHPVDINKVRKS